LPFDVLLSIKLMFLYGFGSGLFVFMGEKVYFDP
jgi:hypothetical protein